MNFHTVNRWLDVATKVATIVGAFVLYFAFRSVQEQVTARQSDESRHQEEMAFQKRPALAFDNTTTTITMQLGGRLRQRWGDGRSVKGSKIEEGYEIIEPYGSLANWGQGPASNISVRWLCMEVPPAPYYGDEPPKNDPDFDSDTITATPMILRPGEKAQLRGLPSFMYWDSAKDGRWHGIVELHCADIDGWEKIVARQHFVAYYQEAADKKTATIKIMFKNLLDETRPRRSPLPPEVAKAR